MDFIVGGVFQVERRSNGHIDDSRSAKRRFWDSVEAERPGLKHAFGCYVFVVYNGGSAKPWYVGKAELQPFANEIFSAHKLNRYNGVTVDNKGTPYIFLIPRVTPTGKLCGPTKRYNPSIGFLETLLIGMALRQNPSLSNIKDTSLLRKLRVHKVINSVSLGRSSDAVVHLKKTLGLRK